MSESIDLIRKQIRDRQISRIISLKPGRELDALVAKYVMNLYIEKWSSVPGEPLDYWYRSNKGVHIDKEEVERVPNYSTVLYSAEKILAKFTHWLIQTDPDGKGIAAAFSVKSKEDSTINGCSSIPEAISKAALIAVVEENKIIEQLLID